MEEKERYIFGQRILYDNEKEVVCFDGFNLDEFMGIITNLLNRQDKENQQLKQQLLEYQEQSIRDNQNWVAETTELQQQLEEAKQNGNYQVMLMCQKENILLKQQFHDLPKKIVEEIEKNFTEYLPLKDKTGAGFYSRLNAILKKYGGEDE